MRLAVAAATQAGVRHGQQIRPVEREFGDDLVVEVVAGAPVPLPSGQPPWIMKSLMMRWKVRPL